MQKLMKNLTLQAVLVTLALTLGTAGTATADYTWHEHNGHWYAETQVTSGWVLAETEAVSQGGHLVTINDAAENA